MTYTFIGRYYITLHLHYCKKFHYYNYHGPKDEIKVFARGELFLNQTNQKYLVIR